jgi:hypothetical protein
VSTAHEDGPPLIEPPERSFPPEATTLRPPPETVEKLNAEIVKHEGQRVAEWLGNLDAKLTAIDAGVGAALQASERAEASAERGRADVHLWLFGDGKRPGLAQGIDATNRTAKDALDKATEAATAALEALKLAKQVYDRTYHPPAEDADQPTAPRPVARISDGPTRR